MCVLLILLSFVSQKLLNYFLIGSNTVWGAERISSPSHGKTIAPGPWLRNALAVICATAGFGVQPHLLHWRPKTWLLQFLLQGAGAQDTPAPPAGAHRVTCTSLPTVR